jgi:hypothetical protein
MLKRVLPLLLALAVAGAPAALEACAATCASTMAGPATSHGADRRSCHDEAAPQGPRVSPVPQPCSHGGDLSSTVSIDTAQKIGVAIPLALIVSSETLVAPLRIPILASARTTDFLDPVGLGLVLPLRI